LCRTIKNGIDSPLLRLPAELRNRIWEQLYGGNVIHVYYRSRGLTNMVCVVCDQQDDPAKTVFCCSRHSASAISVPFVCKQYFGEASMTFFASNVFGVDNPTTLRAFAASNPNFIARVRQLIVQAASGSFAASWGSVMNPSLLGHFKSLRGVSLSIPIMYHELSLLDRTNIMDDGKWKSRKVPSVIRAFQQHRLQKDLTTVNLVPRSYFYHWNKSGLDTDQVKVGIINDTIKDLLLEHHPRRLSRRGLKD
jgi:hypothetical protein